MSASSLLAAVIAVTFSVMSCDSPSKPPKPTTTTTTAAVSAAAAVDRPG